MEVAALTWTIKKLRHLVEATKVPPVIVYTDHSATVQIVKQTSLNTVSTEKLNLRLIRASEYLQRFRLDVRYKPGKSNVIPDALSRLASRDYSPETEATLDSLHCFPVTLVQMSEDFMKSVRDGYTEPRWARILKMVTDNDELGDNAATLPYLYRNGLLYVRDAELGNRLCIPSSVEATVFKLAHDDNGHPGFARTHERLTQGLYFHNLSSRLREYIRHCPQCRTYQTPRHMPNGSLQPILPSTAKRPFECFTIDFILALPVSADGFNCVMSLTCKFSKAVTFIPGKDTWKADDWADALLERLTLLNWGLPQKILSDRDAKFLGDLWKGIFQRLQVTLLFATAYHPQTDGSSERTNQTAEIALRFFLAALEDPKLWPTVLSRMAAALNNSTAYSSTVQAPNEVLYGFKTREPLDLIKISDPFPQEAIDAAIAPINNAVTPTIAAQNAPSVQDATTQRDQDAFPVTTRAAAEPAATRENATVSEDAAAPATATEVNDTLPNALYRPERIDTHDAIAFAAMRMKEYYDAKHRPMYFKAGDWVRLRLHRGYSIPFNSRKLGRQFVGPFKVLERIGRLAYRIELPGHMKIHDVISVAHLDPADAPSADPFARTQSPPPVVMVDGAEEWEIEKLIAKRRIRKGRGWSTQYLARWLGWGPEYDEWMPMSRLNNAPALIEQYDRTHGEVALP